MASKSNDFHSLLSVFRDATSSSDSSDRISQKTTSSNLSIAGKRDMFTKNKSANVELTSTTDPAYSPSLMKEHIERILRINSIRESTSAAKVKPDNKSMSNDSPDRYSMHIAICATIVQDFPHEPLWKLWMNETGGDITINTKTESNEKKAGVESNITNKSFQINTSAELYVHAKKPEGIQSEWLRSKTLPVTHRPNWNDVRIIRAMLSLLEAALKNAKTTHVIFCTESCIPVATLKEAAFSILTDKPCIWEEKCDVSAIEQFFCTKSLDWDHSFVDCYDMNNPRCSRFDEHNCWGHLRDAIPGEAIYKALPGWCLLSRKHAQSILDLPSTLGNMNLWPAFEKVWAPEEVYFSTALNICGQMNEVIKRTLTHSKWDHKAVNLQDRAHPFCYDGLFDDALVSQVRRDGCLFLRKMKRSIDTEVWQNIIVRHKKARDYVVPIDVNRSTKREREYYDERRRHGERNDRHHRDRNNYEQLRRDEYNGRRYESDRRNEGNERKRFREDRYRDGGQKWNRRR